MRLYNTAGGHEALKGIGFHPASKDAGISRIIVTVKRSENPAVQDGLQKVGIFGFACAFVMSYGCGRIGTTLIPDTSKPTVTWGRKAMGQHCLAPSQGSGGRQVAEGIIP